MEAFSCVTRYVCGCYNWTSYQLRSCYWDCIYVPHKINRASILSTCTHSTGTIIVPTNNNAVKDIKLSQYTQASCNGNRFIDLSRVCMTRSLRTEFHELFHKLCYCSSQYLYSCKKFDQNIKLVCILYNACIVHYACRVHAMDLYMHVILK